MAETLKFEKAPKEVVKIFEEIIDSDYPDLIGNCDINYTFRTKSRTDDEGCLILADATKLSNRERDLYGFDFEICIHKKSWIELSDSGKRRLAWHELKHLVIKTDADDDPKYDKAGRVQIALLRHDLVIRTFFEEIKRFGPTESEAIAISKLKKYKIRQLRRRE